jgi:hypothetical protein
MYGPSPVRKVATLIARYPVAVMYSAFDGAALRSVVSVNWWKSI